MSDTRYDRDHKFREELAELADEHGFVLDGFQVADKLKASENVRVLTVKATRSLDVEQGRLGLLP